MRSTRGQRSKPCPIILTQRDLNILSLTGLVKHLSTVQIAREFFPSVDRARRRIRKLYDNQLLNITLAGSTRSNLVSLSTSGLNLLKTKRPEVAERIRLPKAIRLSSIEHRLACTDTRLYVAAWCRQNNLKLLRWANAGGDVERELGLDEYHLEPDGCFEVETRKGIIHTACEIDCGSEGRRVLLRKLDKYVNAFEDRTLKELWIILTTPGKQRQNTFTQLAKEKNLTRHIRLMTLDTINQRPVKPVVKTLSEVFKVSHNLENVSNGTVN